MKNFIKENWFKIEIFLVILLIAMSVFYYFVILSSQKETRIKEQAQKEQQAKEQAQFEKNQALTFENLSYMLVFLWILLQPNPLLMIQEKLPAVLDGYLLFLACYRQSLHTILFSTSFVYLTTFSGNFL